MIKILEELQEMVMKWGDHASNYFQEKDDLASDYAKISKYIQDQKRREHIDSVLPDVGLSTKEKEIKRLANNALWMDYAPDFCGALWKILFTVSPEIFDEAGDILEELDVIEN